MNVITPDDETYDAAGELFYQGRYIEARDKYLVLAEAGSQDAQVALGWLYQEGLGVTRDLTEAYKWYEKVADTNAPEGQFYLGTLYSYQKKYKMALEYYEKAAAQDYIPAIYRLGLAYQSGEGVDVDRTQAFEHFGRAADRGHVFAKKKIAIDMLKGNHGIANIPMGFFKYVWLIKDIVKIVSNNPGSDLLRW